MPVDAPSSIDRPETATRRPRASLVTSLLATRAWNRSKAQLPTVVALVLVVVGVWQFPYPWSDSAAIITAGVSLLVFDMHVRG